MAHEDPSLLVSKERRERVLVREPAGGSAEGPWRESWHVFPPVATTFRVEVSASLMSAVRAMKPSALSVRTPWVRMVLDGTCAGPGIEIQSKSRLATLETVRRDLEQMYRRG